MKQKHILIYCLIVVFRMQVFANDIPAQFDLRNVDGNNYVSTVKAQQGGTCWAHAAMAAMESNLMRTGTWPLTDVLSEPNLSEYHLDWWNGFNLFYNQDIGMNPAQGLIVHMGGDYLVTTAYLSRGDGAVRDEDGQSYTFNPLRRETSFHYYYPRDVEWYQLKDDLSNIDLIKTQIMTHGAMGTCMYVGTQFLDDSTNGSFYQPPDDPNDPNHAIAIVGWSDTIHTAAPALGAWLCKNSWGSSWGSAWGGNGYFWISYYDKHAGRHPEMGSISFQHVEPMPYDTVYYHDYHGWRDTLNVQEAVNIFIAAGRDSLTAISFFTAADSVHYTAKLYRSRTDVYSDIPRLNHSGFIAHSGFHTVDFDEPAVLMEGDSFYVYLYLNKGGHAYDRTSVIPVLLDVPAIYAQATELTEVPSRASRNESLYKQSGSWYDLQNVDTTANFCIKALIQKSKFSRSDEYPDMSGLLGVYPNPVHTGAVIDYQLSTEAEVNITLYNLSGKKVKTLLNTVYPRGYHWIKFDVSTLSSGIYICILKMNGQLRDSQKMILIK